MPSRLHQKPRARTTKSALATGPGDLRYDGLLPIEEGAKGLRIVADALDLNANHGQIKRMHETPGGSKAYDELSFSEQALLHRGWQADVLALAPLYPDLFPLLADNNL